MSSFNRRHSETYRHILSRQYSGEKNTGKVFCVGITVVVRKPATLALFLRRKTIEQSIIIINKNLVA